MTSITTGTRVHGGDPGTEDYDEGTVQYTRHRGALVAWQGSGVTLWAPLSSLRVGWPGLWLEESESGAVEDLPA